MTSNYNEMENGKWKMENGKWEMENDSFSEHSARPGLAFTS